MTRLLSAAVRLFALLLFGLPLAWLFFIALKSQADFTRSPLGLDFQPTLDNFRRVFSSFPFVRCFLNSVFVSAFSVLLTLAAAAPAAWALALYSFRSRAALTALFLAGLTIPIHVTLLPLLKTTSAVGLSDSLVGLGLVYSAFGLALAVFILREAFAALPDELLQAARLDGCGEWRAFLLVGLPLARPSLAVAAAYTFVLNYNEFAFALTLIRSQHLRTLPLGLTDLSGAMGSADVPAVAAAVTLAVVPSFLLFLFLQKRIVAGLTAGALKG